MLNDNERNETKVLFTLSSIHLKFLEENIYIHMYVHSFVQTFVHTYFTYIKLYSKILNKRFLVFWFLWFVFVLKMNFSYVVFSKNFGVWVQCVATRLIVNTKLIFPLLCFNYIIELLYFFILFFQKIYFQNHLDDDLRCGHTHVYVHTYKYI